MSLSPLWNSQLTPAEVIMRSQVLKLMQCIGEIAEWKARLEGCVIVTTWHYRLQGGDPAFHQVKGQWLAISWNPDQELPEAAAVRESRIHAGHSSCLPQGAAKEPACVHIRAGCSAALLRGTLLSVAWRLIDWKSHNLEPGRTENANWSYPLKHNQGASEL